MAAVALGLGACGRPPGDPETALRATLERAETAAEAGDAEALVQLIARDYSDVAGRSRRDLAMMLRVLLARYRAVELVVTVDRLELFSPVLARVELAIVAGGAGSRGLSADRLRLEASLRDDGGGWRLTSAEWRSGWGI